MKKKFILLTGVLICAVATGSYLFSGNLAALLSFRLIHGIGFGVASTYFATLASEELPSSRLGEGMGYFGVGETITGIFIRVISGKIFDAKGPVYVLIPCGFSLIIAMILIAHSNSELLLNISALFYGVAFGAIFPAVQAWIISDVEAEDREAAVGSFLNFFDLGIGGGSLLLGLVIEATSYKTMYLLLILFIVAYMVLSIYIKKYQKQKSPTESDNS
nr:MFS transporter [Acetonema longum]